MLELNKEWGRQVNRSREEVAQVTLEQVTGRKEADRANWRRLFVLAKERSECNKMTELEKKQQLGKLKAAQQDVQSQALQ